MIKVEKKELLLGMSIGGSLAGKSSTLPILSCVKISVSGNNMVLSSNDGECAVTKRILVLESSCDTKFCVNSSDFIKAVKSIKDNVIDLDTSDNVMTIRHEKGEMQLPIESASDFPTVQKSETEKAMSIKSSILFEWLNLSKEFCGNDELRPMMRGMYFYAENGEVGMCATDGLKLVTDSFKDESNNEDMNAIIQSSAFQTLLSLINGTDETTISISDRNITFSVTDAKMSCVLSHNKFPNFKGVIPNDNTISVKVNKSELLDSVNRAALFANKASSLIVVDLKGADMTLHAEDLDFSKKANESCFVEHSGSDIEIGVKANFLVNCLSSVEDENVVIEMKSKDRAMIFKDSSRDRKTILLMPCLV